MLAAGSAAGTPADDINRLKKYSSVSSRSGCGVSDRFALLLLR
jgi:hypothetical protein